MKEKYIKPFFQTVSLSLVAPIAESDGIQTPTDPDITDVIDPDPVTKSSYRNILWDD